MISCTDTGDALAFVERCDNSNNPDTSITCSHTVTVGTSYTTISTASLGVSETISETIKVSVQTTYYRIFFCDS